MTLTKDELMQGAARAMWDNIEGTDWQKTKPCVQAMIVSDLLAALRYIAVNFEQCEELVGLGFPDDDHVLKQHLNALAGEG